MFLLLIFNLFHHSHPIFLIMTIPHIHLFLTFSQHLIFLHLFWLIDTRDTNHMVSNLNLFTTITSTIHIPVKLPNDQHVVATHIGIVSFAEGFVLTNVLYIPHFSVNLISVSKLTFGLSYCLIFFHGHCYIQNLAHWRTIGIAKMSHDLYQLLQLSASSDFSKSVSSSPCPR